MLVISYEYPPLGGGGSTALKNILNQLSRYYKIHLITSSQLEGKSFVEKHENVTIWRVDVSKKSQYYWRQIEILNFLVRGNSLTKKLLRKYNFHVAWSFFGFPSGLLLASKNIPYIVSLRGSDVPGFNKRFSFQYIPLKPVFKWIWDKSSFIIANSSGLRKLAENFYQENPINVIPNGISTSEFPRHTYEEKHSMVLVARLIPRKSIIETIQGFEKAKEKYHQLKLTIIGDGPLIEECNQLQKNISGLKIVGSIPRDKIPSELTKHDVMVLFSKNEGMSNALLEGLASSLPLLITDTGGSNEIFNQNGIVIGSPSPSKIEEAILEFYSQPFEYRKKMAANSYDKAKQLDWENVADDYREKFDKIITATQYN